MSDEVISCADCRIDFTFTESEATFYASKGLNKPRRCKPCRQKRKAAASPQAVSSDAPAKTQWVGGEDTVKRDRRRDRKRDRFHDPEF